MNTEEEMMTAALAAAKDTELEAQVTAAIMNTAETGGGLAIARAIEQGMQEELLTVPAYRLIFSKAHKLYLDGIAPGGPELINAMTPDELAAVGGHEGVMRLSARCATAATLTADVEKLRGYCAQRKALDLAREVMRAIADHQPAGVALAPLVEMAEEQAAPRAGAVSAQNLLNDVMNRLEIGMKNGGMLGLSTGFPTLDRYTAGLQGGCLYVTAARPGGGKTSFGLSIALHAAELGHRVLFVTAEMTPAALAERLCTMAGQVNKTALLAQDKTAMQSFFDGVRRIKSLGGNFRFLDVGGYASPHAVAQAIRAEHRREPLALVVVDYLQLLRDRTNPQESSVDQIGRASRELCNMGRMLNVPVLALAQMKRGGEGMDGVKGSGDIEQDAHAVLILKRPGAGESPRDCGDDREEPAGPELVVAKNRDGETGAIPLHWIGEYTTYTERTQG